MTSLTTTGDDIKNAIPGSTSAYDDPVRFLAALNLGIRDAWPAFGMVERSTTAATLVAGTFDYTMAGLTISPSRDMGIAKVFIQEEAVTDAPDVPYNVCQYFDTSADAWYLRFSPAVVSSFAGKVVNVMYRYPHPDVTTSSQAIYLPEPVLAAFMARWAAYWRANQQGVDTKNMLALYRAADEAYTRAINRNKAQNMAPLRIISPTRNP